jgi:hypothetical protein
MTRRSPGIDIPMTRAAAEKSAAFKTGGAWRFLEGGLGLNSISPATSFRPAPRAA